MHDSMVPVTKARYPCTHWTKLGRWWGMRGGIFWLKTVSENHNLQTLLPKADDCPYFNVECFWQRAFSAHLYFERKSYMEVVSHGVNWFPTRGGGKWRLHSECDWLGSSLSHFSFWNPIPGNIVVQATELLLTSHLLDFGDELFELM